MFDIVLADPPWRYNSNTGKEGLAESHYRIMSLEQIKTIPVSRWVKSNSALFLWTTCPKINEAVEVIKSWGFEYKTVAFTWIKLKAGKPFLGLGNYTRSCTELCLLAMKGKMTVLSHSIPQIVISPLQEHSRKPDIVRERIEQLFGDCYRLELFGRYPRQGWILAGEL